LQINIAQLPCIQLANKSYGYFFFTSYVLAEIA